MEENKKAQCAAESEDASKLQCVVLANRIVEGLRLNIPRYQNISDIQIPHLVEIHCRLLNLNFEDFLPSNIPWKPIDDILLSLRDRYGADQFDHLDSMLISNREPTYLFCLLEIYETIFRFHTEQGKSFHDVPNRTIPTLLATPEPEPSTTVRDRKKPAGNEERTTGPQTRQTSQNTSISKEQFAEETGTTLIQVKAVAKWNENRGERDKKKSSGKRTETKSRPFRRGEQIDDRGARSPETEEMEDEEGSPELKAKHDEIQRHLLDQLLALDMEAEAIASTITLKGSFTGPTSSQKKKYDYFGRPIRERFPYYPYGIIRPRCCGTYSSNPSGNRRPSRRERKQNTKEDECRELFCNLLQKMIADASEDEEELLETVEEGEEE